VPGARVGLVGRNGTGKSTLFNVITGDLAAEHGSVELPPRWRIGSLAQEAPDGPESLINVVLKADLERDALLHEAETAHDPHRIAEIGIGRTFQNLALFQHMSVLDNIMVGRHHLLKNNFITGSLYWLTGARREELEHRRKVEEIIDFLDLQSVRKATAGTLPYGLRKRVELARAMALEPQLILLDEPMAGMNFEEKEDMARYIVDLNEEFGMTVVMIEHDMGVVMDISHRVMVLDFGRKIAEGDPAAVLADPHVKRAYLGEEDEALVDPDDNVIRFGSPMSRP